MSLHFTTSFKNINLEFKQIHVPAQIDCSHCSDPSQLPGGDDVKIKEMPQSREEALEMFEAQILSSDGGWPR